MKPKHWLAVLGLAIPALVFASVSVTVNGTSYPIPQTNEKGWGNNVTTWIQAISANTLQPSGGTFTLSADVDFGASFGLDSLYYKSRSSNVAGSGILRLANTDGVGFRNAANSGDLLLSPNATDGILNYNSVALANVSASQTLTNKTYQNAALSGNATLTGTTDSVQWVVKGNATQTSDLAEWQNSSGTPLAKVDQSGNVTAASFIGPLTGAVTGNVTGNVSGTSANVTGTVAIANGGSGQTTRQAAIDALSGTQSSGTYLRSDGTHTALTSIQAADVPTLNQNTTGTASNVTGTVGIANGGTGQVTANAALNALLPTQTGNSGKLLSTNGTSTSWTSAATGTVTSVQVSGANGLSFSGGPITTSGTITASLHLPTVQKFTTTGTTTGYVFTISTSSTVAVGDTYTNNGNTYTVLAALSAQSGQVLFTSGASAPLASGTLTRATGAGTATITFTASTALATYTTPTGPSPLYVRVRMVGGGGGGGGTGSGAGAGGSGGTTAFGALLLSANGGAGGANSSTLGPSTGGTSSLGTGPIGIALSGANGSSGVSVPAGMQPIAPPGASSAFGGAGGAIVPGGGNAQANTGSGGAGGATNSTGSNTASAGAAGGFVDAIINSPGATYYYAVGSGGSGGTAGTSGNAGGNGAAGLIEVTEYYQ